MTKMIVWAFIVYNLVHYAQRRRSSKAVIPLFSLDDLDICQKPLRVNDEIKNLVADFHEDYGKFCRLFRADLRQCRVLDAQSSQTLREVKTAILAQDSQTVGEHLTKWIDAVKSHAKNTASLHESGVSTEDTVTARLKKIKGREKELFDMVNASRLGVFSWGNVKNWGAIGSWATNEEGEAGNGQKSQLIEERRRCKIAVELLEQWKLHLRHEVELIRATKDREAILIRQVQDVVTEATMAVEDGGWDALTDTLVEAFDEILKEWGRTGDYYWQQF